MAVETKAEKAATKEKEGGMGGRGPKKSSPAGGRAALLLNVTNINQTLIVPV
jgi:hypothetical protein